MEISKYQQNNINFTSRNATIRFADAIVRKVNQEYPRISVTKLERMNNADKFHHYLHDKLGLKIHVMRKQIGRSVTVTDTILKYWKVTSDSVKKQKLGNCGESTILAEITAKVNGIHDCYTAGLECVSNRKKMNHSFLYVNAEKPYVIDPWFGFADYVPNALKRYEAEYCNKSGGKLVCYKQMPNRELGPFERLTLECMFPNLIIK